MLLRLRKYCAVVDNFAKKFCQRSISAWFEGLFGQKLQKMYPLIKVFTDFVNVVSELIQQRAR